MPSPALCATGLISDDRVSLVVFVGHALLGFVLAATVARTLGWSRERSLSIGVVAAVFAAVPDVDMAYALLGVAGVGLADALTLAQAFWATGNVVHRAVTHSLVLAVPSALLAALWLAGRRRVESSLAGGRLLGAGALLIAGGVVLVAGVESGPLGAAITVLFCGLIVLVTEQVARRTDHSATAVGLAAAAGLLSHPFGDLFTGQPPAMVYPFDVTLVTARVTLHPDPTLHLLSAFGLELATVWLALVVWARLRSVSVRDVASPWAGLGTGYAVVVVLLPPPTLAVSYHFVFSVLAVGVVGVAPVLSRRHRLLDRLRRDRLRLDRLRRDRLDTVPSPTQNLAVRSDGGLGEESVGRDALGAAVTGLSAVTLAWVAYGLAYLAL
nr:metal-dependent hydrolase [Salinirubrum litoreum]